MNDMSVKIEQLLKLQKGVCEQYEKENKELLKTIKAQEEQIRLLKQLIENQDKIIKALEQSQWESRLNILERCSVKTEY